MPENTEVKAVQENAEEQGKEAVQEDAEKQENEVVQKVDVGRLLSVLNELSDRINGEMAEYEDRRLMFNPKKEGGDNYYRHMDEIHSYKTIIEDYGYDVSVFENLEVDDVTKQTRFTIRITDKNGTYVEYDVFKYREIVLDFCCSEYDLIADALEKMSGNRFPRFEELVHAIVSYLSFACLYKEEQVKVYNKLGWMKYDDYYIFKYDAIYTDRWGSLSGRCINDFYETLKPENHSDEDMCIWIETAIHLMNYSPTASLVIGAGLTGIFRQILNPSKERNININLFGEPGTGKTSLTNFVLSIFGRPEDLEGSFSDTENALESLRGERAVIPLVIDDRMLKLEGKSEKAQVYELLMSIFREYDGKIKERLGKQYEKDSGQRIWSPVLSSSVKSMVEIMFSNSINNYGQYRRFIEIEVDSVSLFEGSEHSEEVNDVAMTCYGYGIEILMEYLMFNNLNRPESIKERFDELNTIIKEKLRKAETVRMKLQSSSQRFALIILSYQIFREALMQKASSVEGYIISERIIKDKMDEITNILIENLVEKMKRVKTPINAKKYIINFINKHQKLFFQEKKQWDGSGAFLGKLVITDEKYEITIKGSSDIGWILISPEALKEEDIKKYLEILIKHGMKHEDKEVRAELVKLLGEDPTKKNFFNLMKSIKGITVEKRAQSGIRVMIITIMRQDFEAVEEATEEKEGEEGEKIEEVTETVKEEEKQ